MSIMPGLVPGIFATHEEWRKNPGHDDKHEIVIG